MAEINLKTTLKSLYFNKIKYQTYIFYNVGIKYTENNVLISYEIQHLVSNLIM